jgi:hypothetical protein
MGSTVLLTLRRTTCCGFLTPLRIYHHRPRFEPTNTGSNGKHANHYTTEATLATLRCDLGSNGKHANHYTTDATFATLRCDLESYGKHANHYTTEATLAILLRMRLQKRKCTVTGVATRVFHLRSLLLSVNTWP